MSEDQKLAGCPFCGGAARIESNREWHKLFAAHDDDCVLDADEADLTYPANPGYLIQIAERAIRDAKELTALRAFVHEVSQQDPAQVPGQRQSNKERAEDLCEQWGITA